MEALVLIFGEILLACLMPVIGFAGAILGAIFEAVAAIVGAIFGLWADSREPKQLKSNAEKKAKPRKPLIPRKVVHWVAGSFAVVGLVGVLAAFLLMEPILRFVMDKAAARTGAIVEFERAEGNLLVGRVALFGVTAQRDSGEKVGFDIRADKAEADVVLLSLLGGTPEIELGVAQGVTGYVSLPPRDKDKPKTKKPKRPYRIDMLSLSDVALEIRPHGAPAYPLVVESAQVAPLRSSLALFDLLFRSNMKAEIAGQSIEVATRKISENGRETLWRMQEVEAEKLRQIMPRAPLTWLHDGRVDVTVVDRWDLAHDWIEMDWQVKLAGIAVKVPKEAGRGEKLLGTALAGVVKAKGGTADFRYQLALDEGQIDALRSGDLSQFWDVVLSGFLKKGGKGAAAAATDPSPGNEEGGKVKGALGKVKSLLKREKGEE